jgi:hypothetical protein
MSETTAGPSTTFRGYPIELLIKVKAMGRSLIDDALYEASQAYTDPKRGGGTLGPALLAADSSVSVTPATVRSVPQDGGAVTTASPVATVDPDDDSSPWGRFTLLEIRDILVASGVKVPRTMTKGGAIRRAEEAGLTPPPE